MALKISEKVKLLHFQLETNAGTEVAQTATSVLLTQNLQAVIGEGDTTTDEYDGESSRDRPVSSGNLRNSFNFDLPVTMSGTAGTAPSIGALLKTCGFKETVTANTSVKYEHCALSDIKTGSLLMRRPTGANNNDLTYKTKGSQGIVGLEIKIGQRPKLKVSMTGDYIEPRYVYPGTVTPTDYGTQKSLVCDVANPGVITAVKLNNKTVCLDAFSCTNLSGLDLKYFSTSCGSSVLADVSTPEAVLTGAMPDWGLSSDFNPFVYGRTDIGVNRFPLEITIGTVAGKKLTLYCAEVQPNNPKETTIGGGALGFELGLRLLSPVSLTFS